MFTVAKNANDSVQLSHLSVFVVRKVETERMKHNEKGESSSHAVGHTSFTMHKYYESPFLLSLEYGDGRKDRDRMAIHAEQELEP
jgi:hypothetical protein